VVQRVVTGHDERGRSGVVSDDDADAIEYGGAGGVFQVVWGRDDEVHFPDSGNQRDIGTLGAGGPRLLDLAQAPPTSYAAARKATSAAVSK